MESRPALPRSPLQTVWFGGIFSGTLLGAALGAIVGASAGWVQEGADSSPGWAFIAPMGAFALFGVFVGAVCGFLIGCWAGFVAGVLLSILLRRFDSPRLAALVTIAAALAFLLAATAWLSGWFDGLDEGDWTALVVPAIAFLPLRRTVLRAAQPNESERQFRD